ncbi:DUF6502 family protein [Acidisphaera sp. S103]|uniref:DUF6502 family protein n=1 Tax=Acidisphaera sp. S103 TaxID=1747223 RepID=UPI00131C1DDC|nr:DUF6502 family protein [Acidisphaera sp. S103]
MPTDTPPQPSPPAALLAASSRLLRPLVRLMVRGGITFPVLTDVLRRLFVEVAVTDILTQPKARTDSRISLLTGVHRKEIRRFREMPPDSTSPPEVVTVSTQIIALWLGSPRFVDDRGRPRSLPRAAEPGSDAPSFESLVSSVTTDIRPRAVLDDWLSQGLVSMAASDHVVLNAEAFIPRPGGAEQLFYFARNLHDHVSAAVANISAGDTAPFLDRSVHYDKLTLNQVRDLEAFARDVAVRALLEVNRKALELIDAAPTGDEPTHRLNFGAFVFNENDLPTQDQPALAGGAAA